MQASMPVIDSRLKFSAECKSLNAVPDESDDEAAVAGMIATVPRAAVAQADGIAFQAAREAVAFKRGD